MKPPSFSNLVPPLPQHTSFPKIPQCSWGISTAAETAVLQHSAVVLGECSGMYTFTPMCHVLSSTTALSRGLDSNRKDKAVYQIPTFEIF